MNYELSSKKAASLRFDDHRFDPDAWVLASRKRLLLALYIDYLIVGSFWAIIQFVVGQVVPTIGALPGWGKWLLFAVLELSVVRWKTPSLGAAVLSMRLFEYRATDEVGRLDKGRPWFVDARVKRHETWVSMLIALLFVSDGVKAAVRWTMWNPPQPLFGVLADPMMSTIAYVTVGAFEVWVGYLIFTLNRKAFALALVYLGAQAVSIVMSWKLWAPFFAEMIERREAYLGTGRAAERVGVAQAIMPEALLVAIALLAILLTIQLFKYRNLSTRPRVADAGSGEIVRGEE